MKTILKEIKVINKQHNSKMCFACGLSNRFGLKSRFYELENAELLAIFTPAVEHQGYPGRLHGGLAATILDETIGRSIMMTQSESIWGVTIDFSMRLRKPIPLDSEIKVLARITHEDKRFFEGNGEILINHSMVAVAGKGRYLKMDISKIADFDVEEQQWRVEDSPDDPLSVIL